MGCVLFEQIEVNVWIDICLIFSGLCVIIQVMILLQGGVVSEFLQVQYLRFCGSKLFGVKDFVLFFVFLVCGKFFVSIENVLCFCLGIMKMLRMVRLLFFLFLCMKCIFIGCVMLLMRCLFGVWKWNCSRLYILLLWVIDEFFGILIWIVWLLFMILLIDFFYDMVIGLILVLMVDVMLIGDCWLFVEQIVLVLFILVQ